MLNRTTCQFIESEKEQAEIELGLPSSLRLPQLSQHLPLRRQVVIFPQKLFHPIHLGVQRLPAFWPEQPKDLKPMARRLSLFTPLLQRLNA
jgi:hypothetical protein